MTCKCDKCGCEHEPANETIIKSVSIELKSWYKKTKATAQATCEHEYVYAWSDDGNRGVTRCGKCGWVNE